MKKFFPLIFITSCAQGLAGSPPEMDADISADRTPELECKLASDVLGQNGCAEGETCDISTDRQSINCRPIGTKINHGECDLPSDCAAGYTCFALPDYNQECLLNCDALNPENTICPEYGTCITNIPGPPELGVCWSWSDDCNPVTQLGCLPGQQCFMRIGEAFCEFPTPNPGAEGEVCEENSAFGCQIGLSCLRENVLDEDTVCVPHCYLTSSSCTNGRICTPYGHLIFGLCI